MSEKRYPEEFNIEAVKQIVDRGYSVNRSGIKKPQKILGLGSIWWAVGHELYGSIDQRLMLHADQLVFQHPASGETLTLEQPAPF